MDMPIQNDKLWDHSLEEISEQEKIRYKIYKRWGELNHGESLTLEEVFGNNGVSLDEYSEFLGVIMKISNPFPSFDTLEQMKEAEANVENKEATAIIKIANTYLLNSDFVNANKWFLRAAKLGNGEALCRLAGAYRHGKGVDLDLNMAVRFYKEAIIADGNRDALLDLALCYLKGEGVPQNTKHGFFLMERSAKLGNMMAQYNMGFLYRTGTGVHADADEALRWYRVSANQGYELAIEFLARYEKQYKG